MAQAEVGKLSIDDEECGKRYRTAFSPFRLFLQGINRTCHITRQG
jgi:hypothetical protein